MSLFRIWPFRVLLLLVVSLLATDLALVTTSGHPSASSALHVVAASDYTIAEPSINDELRTIKSASRSHSRAVLPQAHPQAVHVTCWNGKVVVEHPGIQDCPDRPKPKPVAVPEGAYAWAHTYFAIRVANCESGGGPSDRSAHYDGDAHLRDPNGHYGKWQFAPSTADGVGAPGAGIADLSEAQQDYFAWKLWQRDGWSPWECAHLV